MKVNARAQKAQDIDDALRKGLKPSHFVSFWAEGGVRFLSTDPTFETAIRCYCSQNRNSFEPGVPRVVAISHVKNRNAKRFECTLRHDASFEIKHLRAIIKCSMCKETEISRHGYCKPCQLIYNKKRRPQDGR